MFEFKTYTQKEMFELLNTDRNDVIKKKLTTQGYIFTTEGRGKKLQITITGYEPPLHEEFKRFCIDELGYNPRVNFDKLYIFFSKFFYDEELRRLPFTEITRKLENEVHISRQTISKWIHHLMDEDILLEGDYYYYAHGYDADGNKQIVPIDRETYSNGWKEYWTGETTNYYEELSPLLSYVCCFPQKVRDKVFSFKYEKVERLMKIIDKEKKTNEKNIS